MSGNMSANGGGSVPTVHNPGKESDAQSHPKAMPEVKGKMEGPGHPLGPYAPRPAGKVSGEPRPDGQYPHASVAGSPVKDPKGIPAKADAVPKPNGQYPHTTYMGGGKE